MMKLELQNIGGFTGVHTFDIQKGINRITAPNAKGKSSLLRGLQCLASDDEAVFRDSLNDDNDTGTIKLDNEYVRNLRRVNNIVQATQADDRTFFDENSEWRNAEKIAFFTPKSRVVLEIDQNAFDVLRFVKSVSGAEIVESDLRRKETQLGDAKQKLDEYIENLTNAQKLEAEIKTMQGDIQKLQGEVQELEAEIAKESGTMDITDISRDLATKKREIEGLHERLRVREGEVKRYQDEYEKARVQRERINEEIDEFEQTYESPEKSIEGFKANIHKHERRKKSLKRGKDMVDSLLGVINEAYKMFGETERVVPEEASEISSLEKAYSLLGEPRECPVCSGGADRDTLEHRRDELRACATDLSKDMRGEDEQTKMIKLDMKELQDKVDGLRAKRRALDEAKRNAEEYHKDWDERKDTLDAIEREISEKESELENLERQYEDATKNVQTKSRERLNEMRKKVGGFENEIRNNHKQIDRLTSEIPDYMIGETLEEYARKKNKGLEQLRIEIGELETQYDHEVRGAVKRFNDKINNIYHDMGFTTFRDIKIREETTRGRPSSLDVIVEHESGKKQSLSSLSKAEQLTLGLVFQISAKENYIPAFPFFVIDDNMNTFDPDRFKLALEYLADKAEYVIVSQPVSPSEQDELVIKYGLD